MPALESLLDRLIQGRVQFCIVGGFAAMAHGVTLLTQDLDICLPFSTENLSRLQNALAGLNPVHRMTPQRLPLEITEENASRLKNLYLDTDIGQVDCLGEVKGVGGFDAVLGLSQQVTFGQRQCWLLGIDGLIRAKEAMGRPHDQLTILQLRAIQHRQSQGA